MKKKMCLLVLMSVIGCHLMGADITPEKPTTEDVLNVMGYSWWKFSVPNEKKLKTLQCALFMYTKDKHGVWNKQQIHAGVFTQGKDIKPTVQYSTVVFLPYALDFQEDKSGSSTFSLAK